MPRVSFTDIAPGSRWERVELAKLWGYESYHPLGRGVFTPKDSSLIILFVTEQKRGGHEPYTDMLDGDSLQWHGEKGHGNDHRIVSAATRGDEIHVFYRDVHHASFTYIGQASLKSSTLLQAEPSRFVFRITPI